MRTTHCVRLDTNVVIEL